LSYTR